MSDVKSNEADGYLRSMSVRRNTLYNLAGATVPIVLALVTVPLYLRVIGTARYGVLAIVWLILSYFGTFDLGLSRAAANRIAQMRHGPATEREQVFWTACLLNSGIGAAAGLGLYVAGGQMLEHWFRMSGSLHAEAARALPWMAIAVPIATVTAALTGTLEGLQRFSTVNVIQSVGTALFQTVPLVTAYAVGPQLQYVIPAAVIARLVTALPLFSAVRRALPLTGPPRMHAGYARQLIAYGSWVAVTNLVGPILHVFDRFLVGIVLGASAVAYYVVPFQLVNRSQIVPGALSRALFPHLSVVDSAEARAVSIDAVVTLAAIMTPLTIIGLLVIAPFLRLWVGSTFASHAIPVGEILLFGIWINGLAFVPFALLQARGRPDVVAKFHLLEVVPFLLILWFALTRIGIAGAATAWTLRVTIDAALLFIAADLPLAAAKPLVPGAALIAATALCLHLFPSPTALPRLYLGGLLLLLSCAWSILISAHVRQMVSRLWRHPNAIRGDQS